MPHPYVGITGFMERYEVDSVMAHLPSNSKRKLMVGVLASAKTMKGIKNKWPNRYPAMEDIAGIFPEDPRALNLIHFNTKEPERLPDQLEEMVAWGGACLHGFQLNVAWPDINQLVWFRKRHPDIGIVLQLGGKAMEIEGNTPKTIAQKAAGYINVADYVLVDPSGGLGKPFDASAAAGLLRALANYLPGIGLGVAGGLSAGTIHQLEPLLPLFPALSWDAEGRLRTESDNLDLKASGEYIDASLALSRR